MHHGGPLVQPKIFKPVDQDSPTLVLDVYHHVGFPAIPKLAHLKQIRLFDKDDSSHNSVWRENLS